MKLIFTKFLRSLGLIKYDILSTKAESFPNMASYNDTSLVVVEDAGVQKWACSLVVLYFDS